MKHLPKHLRPRWRYLVVTLETWPDVDLDRDGFQASVWAAARALLGDPGCADVDLRVLRFQYTDGAGTAMVRVRRGEVDRGRAVLACLDCIDDAPLGLTVDGVSGTMRAAEEKYMNAPTGPLGEERVAFENSALRAVVRPDGRYDLHGPGGFTGATQLDLE